MSSRLDELFIQLLDDYREMINLPKLLQKYKTEWDDDRFSWTDLEVQQLVHDKVLQDTLCLKFPPSPKYTMKFLSFYISEIERKNKEVYEALYTKYLQYLSQVDNDKKDVFYRTYRILKPGGVSLPFDTVTLKMCDEWNAVGLIPWTAGFVLAEFVVSNSELFSEKVCLELGSGVGLTGIVALKTTRLRHIILSDSDDKVLQNLTENLIINGIDPSASSRVSVCRLDWSECHTRNFSLLLYPHIVLAADVIYDPDVSNDFIKCLISVMRREPNNGNCCAYVATTLRNPSTFDQFRNSLTIAGLRHTDITQSARINPLFRSISPMNGRSQVILLRVEIN
jgi:predicted nicotinamide N-methyase